MEPNNTVTCPHCMNNVPWGARVCQGCQAEISYGTPFATQAIFVFLSIGIAWYATKLVHDYLFTNSTLLWLVFAAVITPCALVSRKICKRLYDGKTQFKRYYRN
ncbi:MAG: hypothetical protein ACK4VV_16135 [Pseudomonas sp.]